MLLSDRSRPFAAADAWSAYHRQPASVRGLGWLVVLGAHAALLTLWLSYRAPVAPPIQKPVVMMRLMPLEPPPPPPPPEEAPPPTPKPPRPQAVRPKPQPVQRPEVQPATPRPLPLPPAPPGPRHADSNEWVQPDSDGEAAPTARRAPSDYAEAVKSRVIGKVVYPANAVYPKPKGFKGDPRELMRQCTIPYEVLVDRQGQIVSYEIERCQDDLLDAAAEAAILKAQPFPPPPEGAQQYRIYGSINFLKPRLGGAAGPRP